GMTASCRLAACSHLANGKNAADAGVFRGRAELFSRVRKTAVPPLPAAKGPVDMVGGGGLSFSSGLGKQLPHQKVRVSMAEQTTRVKVTKLGTLSLVQFADRKILDELAIQEIQDELLKLVTDRDDGNRLVLSFANVDHLSSAALGMLI